MTSVCFALGESPSLHTLSWAPSTRPELGACDPTMEWSGARGLGAALPRPGLLRRRAGRVGRHSPQRRRARLLLPCSLPQRRRRHEIGPSARTCPARRRVRPIDGYRLRASLHYMGGDSRFCFVESLFEPPREDSPCLASSLMATESCELRFAVLLDRTPCHGIPTGPLTQHSGSSMSTCNQAVMMLY